MKQLWSNWWISIGLTVSSSFALADEPPNPFRFEAYASIEPMQEFLLSFSQTGTSREDLRQVFVEQGRATLIEHPELARVEKYIYDINLCSYYIWRWNVSADFNSEGKLDRLYLNGERLFPGRVPKSEVNVAELAGTNAAMFRGQRRRPQAFKGEMSLGYILYDKDGITNTISDQRIIGAGPTRADPIDMGKLLSYANVDLWRSIFDNDDANFIAPYPGDCEPVDRHHQGITPRRQRILNRRSNRN